MMVCERCGREMHSYNTCDYCHKKICYACLKSSKKVSQTKKAFICKDCWGNMRSRQGYKRT